MPGFNIQQTASKCNVKQGLTFSRSDYSYFCLEMCNQTLVLSCNVFRLPQISKLMSGLKCVHLNVCSLLPKLDMVRIWVSSTDADIVIISETWLMKSITNEDISIFGYKVYRTDRPKKGGGVAIYVKSRFDASIVPSESICKQLELLALKVEIAKSLSMNVVGCYTSATKEALSSLIHLLSKLNYNELLMAGDLNWDWLNAVSD